MRQGHNYASQGQLRAVGEAHGHLPGAQPHTFFCLEARKDGLLHLLYYVASR
ncbi:hypothetical protein TorRG33x02_225390, partial [Trema orientale]